MFRRFRFVLAILLGVAAALLAERLGLGRGAVLALIVGVAILYMILEWRYEEPPRRERRERRRRSGEKYRSPFAVSFDDTEIVVTLDGVRRESVSWQNLIAVGIRVDEDAFLPSTYWVLGGTSGGCYFPTEAEGGDALLAALQARLPNFDNRALIEAMGLMEGGRMIWQRSAVESSGG